MNELTTAERLGMLDDAQDLLREAHELLTQALRFRGRVDANAKAYLINRLEILAADGHGFLTQDPNVDTYRQTILDNAERGPTREELIAIAAGGLEGW